MEANASLLDESLLATTTAWMRKADKDKLDGESVHLPLLWPPLKALRNIACIVKETHREVERVKYLKGKDPTKTCPGLWPYVPTI